MQWRSTFKRHQPAAQRRAVLTVDYDRCHECGACVAVCPPDALFLSHQLTVNQRTCTACDRCVKVCPVRALSLVPAFENGAADENRL